MTFRIDASFATADIGFHQCLFHNRSDHCLHQKTKTKNGGAEKMSETGTAVPIPITTRGIGIHTNNYYNFVRDALGQTPAPLPCTVYQMYRVSLLQLDVRIQCCQAASILPFDPETDVTYPLPYLNEFTDHSIVGENFQCLARAISSVGNFTEADIAYQPYVPHMHDRYADDVNENGDASDLDQQVEPDPYLVTIQNLRSVVVALANPNTTLRLRRRFIHRNPLPGAVFVNNVLMNADDIMPDNYDFKMASDDCVAFLKLMQSFGEHSRLIQPIRYQCEGHISILTSLHHPRNAFFALTGTKLTYSEQSTIRSYQPAGELDQFEGCVNLMNEFPSTLGRGSDFRDIKRWSIRCEYVSSALYNTNWLSALNSLLHTHDIPYLPNNNLELEVSAYPFA